MAQILVVDDVKFIARMIASIFESDGHEVTVATTGAEALSEARRGLPDLILLDMKMPEIDGLEVARALRRDPRTLHIPIMMVSSRSDLGSVANAFAADVSEYVTKPFETAELVEKAGSLLGGFRMNYSIDEVEQVPTVTVLHDEIAAGTLEDLPQALSMAGAEPERPVVLDLSRVRTLEAGFEEALENFQRSIGEMADRLEIVRPTDRIGASAIFPGLPREELRLHESRGSALAAARGKGPEPGADAKRSGEVSPSDEAALADDLEAMNANVRLVFEMFDNMTLVRLRRSELTEETIEAVGRDYPRSAHVVLADLSAVSGITGSQLRALGELVNEITLSGRTFRIVNPSPDVSEALRRAGFGAQVLWMKEHPRT